MASSSWHLHKSECILICKLSRLKWQPNAYATGALQTRLGARLIDALENENLDYMELADTLGIQWATTRSFIATFWEIVDVTSFQGERVESIRWMTTWETVYSMFKRSILSWLYSIWKLLPDKPAVSLSTIARVLDVDNYLYKVNWRHARRAEFSLRLGHARWNMRNGLWKTEGWYNMVCGLVDPLVELLMANQPWHSMHGLMWASSTTQSPARP